MKKCSKCGEEKDDSSFSKDSNKRDGLYSSCNLCRREISKKNYQDRKERNKQLKSTPEFKTCTQCNLRLPTSNFSKRTASADGLAHRCKYCVHKYSVKYRKRNKEIISEKGKAYHENNKTKISKRKSQYYIENREYILKRNYAWESEAKQGKPLFALRKVLRSRTAEAFYRGGFSKNSKTAEMLGCDWDFFLSHLQSKFTAGMTWENRGEWHMDHIIPLSSAKTEEKLIALCHYTNLQPLWAADNLKKSDSLDW